MEKPWTLEVNAMLSNFFRGRRRPAGGVLAVVRKWESWFQSPGPKILKPQTIKSGCDRPPEHFEASG